jgi:two-component system response regulator AtoC
VDGAIYHITADRETPVPKNAENRAKSGVIIGNSKEMKEIFKMIGILCQNRATALIQGETGTGKELIARTIHKNCLFCDEPFITFDCSSVVENLLESELFGHEKGAFTGAVQAKTGKIELAGSGTLFLDEIGELPLNLQSKFLGFLERGEYMRVGGNRPLKSRCRIIAATNQNLERMVDANRFRNDLYYRLKVVTIQVPALRRRLSDVPDLADHFLQKAAGEMGGAPLKLQAGCIELLKSHPWTGNVRELRNVILAAAVRTRGNVILKEDIDHILQGNTHHTSAPNASMALSDMEKHHILNTLFKVNWNRTHAARLLKISLPTLRKKIKKYRIAHAADNESDA